MEKAYPSGGCFCILQFSLLPFGCRQDAAFCDRLWSESENSANDLLSY